MELQQLEYFVAAATTLSFTKAAESCHVVQTTVSHAVATLERELGARLFVREAGRVSLTPEGKTFLPEAAAVVEAARHARQSLLPREAAGKPVLRVGYYGVGLGDDFPDVVSRFTDATGAAMAMHNAKEGRDDLVDNLAQQSIDAFIIARSPFGEEIPRTEGCVIALNRVYLQVSSADELARDPAPLPCSALAGMADSLCLYRASSLGSYRNAMRSWLSEGFSVDPDLVAWESSMEELRLRVSCGLCRTLTFRNSEEPFYREGGSMCIRVDGTDYLPVSLVWNRGDANPLIAAFAQTAREVSSRRGIDLEHVGELRVLSPTAVRATH